MPEAGSDSTVSTSGSIVTSTVTQHQNYIHKIEKMIQLLGDEVPQTIYRGFAPGPHWRTAVPRSPDFGLLCKILIMPLPAVVFRRSRATSWRHKEILHCLKLRFVSFEHFLRKLGLVKTYNSLFCCQSYKVYVQFNVCSNPHWKFASSNFV